MRRKIGFLGSSYDPITNGHMITIQEMLDNLDFDMIYLMPSSKKRRDKTMNVADEHRLAMIQLAVHDNPQLGIETIEMDSNLPSWEVYTFETMRKLRKKYPNDDLYFLMGADLLVDIANGKWNHIPGSWTHVNHLLSENKFVVIRRNGLDMHETIAKSKILRKYRKNIELLYTGADNNISSSYVREEFENGHNPRYYILPAVYKYIKDNNLYVSNE